MNLSQPPRKDDARFDDWAHLLWRHIKDVAGGVAGSVSSVAGRIGDVILTKSDVGLSNVDNTADSAKNVLSASKLTTARTINGVAFDGTANITVEDSTKADASHVHTFASLTSKPTTLAGYGITDAAGSSHNHTVSIGDGTSSLVSFGTNERFDIKSGSNVSIVYDDATNSITISTTGTLTGNAETASRFLTPRNINGVAFDGSANITIYDSTKEPAITAGTSSQFWKGDKTWGTIVASDIPSLDWSKIGSGKPTTLSGYGITDAAASSHVGSGGASHSAVTTSVDGFMSASDKTKLDGIASGANNYTHPASHPPSIITQDTSNRFVTDAEKSTWNGKSDSSHTHSLSIGNGSAPVITYGSNERLDIVAGTNVSISYDDAGNALTISTSGTLTGNAETATKLLTPRLINGVAFDGSANITIPASGIANAGYSSSTGVTNKTFTGIPAGVSRITIIMNRLAFSAGDSVRLRLGTSGGVVSTNVYVIGGDSSPTNGLLCLTISSAGNTGRAAVTLTRLYPGSNTWSFQALGGYQNTASTSAALVTFFVGFVDMPGEVDRAYLYTVGGATFSGGTQSVYYE